MKPLAIDDFPQFFEQITGNRPFPWQAMLARELCNGEARYDVLNLPTGTGKTACIEIAVFHLAFELANGISPRTAPMRIVWIVDRRLIVDEAYDRARHLAKCLEESTDATVMAVASALRLMANGDDSAAPLLVQRLRGGIPREGDWTRSPAQPTFVSSTVDQVGSRLLFRGYGIRNRMRSIHAGLLGEDALLFLDEVHLSEPFRETLTEIATYKRTTGMPWVITQLSATPRAEESSDSRVFELTPEDRGLDVLRARLQRPKLATLKDAGRLRSGSEEHADVFAESAINLASFDERGDASCIAIIVNRVELARKIHERLLTRLQRRYGAEHDPKDDVIRLVGRARNVEKDELRSIVMEWASSKTSTSRQKRKNPRFVVATQTIEAGADLDFDALVTQIAPLASLRQRFGRLNRMGRDFEARATIIAIDEEVAKSAKPDPLYGDASRATWIWLVEQATSRLGATIDFASDAFPRGLDSRSFEVAASHAPVLMPAHVDALSRTLEEPPWSPDPALYLHGARNSPADVTIVWRADIPRPQRTNAGDGAPRAVDMVSAILSTVPPRANEGLGQSLGVVRRWLRQESAGDGADVEGSLPEVESSTRNPGFAWRYAGPDSDVEAVPANHLRPGDTIVVPTSYGGCDRFGWNPASAEVIDVGRIAGLDFRDRLFTLRLNAKLYAQEMRALAVPYGAGDDRDEGIATGWALIARFLVDQASQPPRRFVRDLLLAADALSLPQSWKDDLALLDTAASVALRFPSDGDDGDEGDDDHDYREISVIVVAPRGVKSSQDERTRRKAPPSYESATESDETGATGDGPLTLARHSLDVQDRTVETARMLQLPDRLRDDLSLAGFLHDLGKADPRFQAYLGVGSDGVFAKSGKRRSSSAERAAHVAAGLPTSWRHEALSVRLATVHAAFRDAHDPELVLWLIGTHHGFGRPSFPHEDPLDTEERSFPMLGIDVLTPGAGPQALDFAFVVDGPDSREVDWQMMFARLQQRYGVWSLAYFESVVRLADHRASESPSRDPLSVCKGEVPK